LEAVRTLHNRLPAWDDKPLGTSPPARDIYKWFSEGLNISSASI
jgi:hypothetical protein